jgi:hypothetical protein
MAHIEPTPVRIQSRNHRELAPSKGTINKITWEKQDRFRNAMKSCGLFLTLSFCSILIPFWHFILVPGFFILAWVMLLEKYNEIARNGGGMGSCPQCGTELKIEKSQWKERLTDTCGKCYQDLEITLQSEDR